MCWVYVRTYQYEHLNIIRSIHHQFSYRLFRMNIYCTDKYWYWESICEYTMGIIQRTCVCILRIEITKEFSFVSFLHIMCIESTYTFIYLLSSTNWIKSLFRIAKWDTLDYDTVEYLRFHRQPEDQKGPFGNKLRQKLPITFCIQS